MSAHGLSLCFSSNLVIGHMYYNVSWNDCRMRFDCRWIYNGPCTRPFQIKLFGTLKQQMHIGDYWGILCFQTKQLVFEIVIRINFIHWL